MTQIEIEFPKKTYSGQKLVDAKDYAIRVLRETGARKFAHGWMNGELIIYMRDGWKKDELPGTAPNGVKINYVFF